MIDPRDDLPTLDPLPSRVTALLDAERGREGPPPDLRAQMLAAVAAALEGGRAPAAADGGEGTRAPVATSPGQAPTALRATFRVAAAGAIGVVVGAAIGVAAHAAWSTRVAAPSTEARPSTPTPSGDVADAPGIAPAASPPAPPSVAAPARVTVAGGVAPPSTGSVGVHGMPSSARRPSPVGEAIDPALEAERTLLERARAALARGDGGAALEAVGMHERRFPNGRLRDERELLGVRALVLAGRGEEASVRAARFAAAAPGSPLLPTIRRAAGVTKTDTPPETSGETP